MFSRYKETFIKTQLTVEEIERVEAASRGLNSAGFDRWGLDPQSVKLALAGTKLLYREYFRVETTGIDRIPEGPILLIANHGGQLPIDGMLIGTAMLLEANPPRLIRGMVERWAPSVPFVATFFSRLGQMVGDQRNCRELLGAGECVLAFPEGAAGSGKTIQHRYQLQRFGTGFMRLALESGAPIIPVAVIGSEETYPSFLDAKVVARLFNAPYFPITPFFPLFGPLGAIPLPCKISLRFGEPMKFEGDADAPDAEIEKKIDRVRDALQVEIHEGLRLRGDNIFTGSGVE